MKRYPKKIEFEKLKDRLQSQIETLKKYAKQIENKEGFIEELTLPDILNEIDIKEQLLSEYTLRVEEGEKLNLQEKNDYENNFKATLKKAKQFKTDIIVPKQIRTHLKKVLDFDYESLKHIDDKIVYYTALKKEVEMCLNFKASIK